MELYVIKTGTNAYVRPVYIEEDSYSYSLTAENFANMPDNSAGYYEYKNNILIPDIMPTPTFMVSNTVREVIDIYDSTIKYKNIYLMPNKEEDLIRGVQEFNIPSIPRIDCLSKEAIVLPNGTVQEVILDEGKIPNKDIFIVDKVTENIVIVSLRLMESVLRRNTLGIKFEKVRILGGN